MKYKYFVTSDTHSFYSPLIVQEMGKELSTVTIIKTSSRV